MILDPTQQREPNDDAKRPPTGWPGCSAWCPYISRRPGVALADLAVEFGVSTEQINADLDLLMVCGLPGYYPDDLIDVVLDEEGGTVSIAFDAGIERPVRLTSDEAVALTVALRAFADLPGLVDADAVYSALAKLEQAGAETAGAVRVAAADAAPALGAVRQAVDESRQLWMRYYTASRDALTERIVDPIRLLVTDGHAYLEGYCHSADAVRHFRVDRIEEITVLDEPAQGQLWVDSDIPERMFHPDPQIPPVTLRLAPSARWVAEYYHARGSSRSCPASSAPAVRCGSSCGPAATTGWSAWCSPSAAAR